MQNLQAHIKSDLKRWIFIKFYTTVGEGGDRGPGSS